MPEQTTNGTEEYRFILYVDSTKPRSVRAEARLDHICFSHLKDTYTLEVVDLQEELTLFEQEHIIAVPTLDVFTPQGHKHRFVGDLAESEIFVMALGMAREAGKMGQQAQKMEEAAKEMRSKIKSV
jgi:hypothetical protein